MPLPPPKRSRKKEPEEPYVYFPPPFTVFVGPRAIKKQEDWKSTVKKAIEEQARIDARRGESAPRDTPAWLCARQADVERELAAGRHRWVVSTRAAFPRLCRRRVAWLTVDEADALIQTEPLHSLSKQSDLWWVAL